MNLYGIIIVRSWNCFDYASDPNRVKVKTLMLNVWSILRVITAHIFVTGRTRLAGGGIFPGVLLVCSLYTLLLLEKKKKKQFRGTSMSQNFFRGHVILYKLSNYPHKWLLRLYHSLNSARLRVLFPDAMWAPIHKYTMLCLSAGGAHKETSQRPTHCLLSKWNCLLRVQESWLWRTKSWAGWDCVLFAVQSCRV